MLGTTSNRQNRGLGKDGSYLARQVDIGSVDENCGMEGKSYQEGVVEIGRKVATVRRQHADFMFTVGLHAIENEKERIGDALEGEKEHVASELLCNDICATVTFHQ